MLRTKSDEFEQVEEELEKLEQKNKEYIIKQISLKINSLICRCEGTPGIYIFYIFHFYLNRTRSI